MGIQALDEIDKKDAVQTTSRCDRRQLTAALHPITNCIVLVAIKVPGQCFTDTRLRVITATMSALLHRCGHLAAEASSEKAAICNSSWRCIDIPVAGRDDDDIASIARTFQGWPGRPMVSACCFTGLFKEIVKEN